MNIPEHHPRPTPRTIGVIGGGTAGYLAALAIKRHFPAMDVTIVESSAVPIIGVGEATTTLMPPFLHTQLGLDAGALFAAVKPTFKLGIQFEWGLPGDYLFNYSFGDADPIEAQAFDGDLRSQSLLSLLMAEDRVPILRGPEGELLSLLTHLKFGYHLDNAPFVAFLAGAAAQAGIHHLDMKIASVVPRVGGGVDAVRADDGRELRFDFFVDASGFRSLLLESTLGSPFLSYSSTLLCDRAVVATVPQHDRIRPYTTAETMDAGWCWRIPVRHEDHRGYVFSSAFLGEDAAIAEMRAKNPAMGEPWIVRFRSGRHRDFWLGNTVGVGNAYGFVEPLESTALHMVIVEIGYLLAGLEAMDDPQGAGTFPTFANEAVGAHWDYLRWFLGVHYRFNRRLDTPFWKTARAEVDVSGLEAQIARFRREGPWDQRDETGDAVFGYGGLMMMLLGQRVDGPKLVPSITSAAWEARVASQRAMVARALPQRDALEALTADSSMLQALTRVRSSWCRADTERIHLPSITREFVNTPRGDAAGGGRRRAPAERGATLKASPFLRGRPRSAMLASCLVTPPPRSPSARPPAPRTPRPTSPAPSPISRRRAPATSSSSASPTPSSTRLRSPPSWLRRTKRASRSTCPSSSVAPANPPRT